MVHAAVRAGVNYPLAEEKADAVRSAVCDGGAATLAFKETRTVLLGKIAADLPPPMLASTRFVLLLRDPRAVWSSLRPFETWAVHDIGYVCAALRTQYESAPALAAAGALQTIFYEQLVRDSKRVLTELAVHTGVVVAGAEPPAKWLSAVDAKADLLKWRQSVPADEVAQITADADCQAYMQAAGYDEAATYTALVPPAREKAIR